MARKVIPCSELAKESRKRMADRLKELEGAMVEASKDPVAQLECLAEMGRLVHEESLLMYNQIEIPAAARPAPHIHIIKLLPQESPEIRIPPNALMDGVELHQKRLTESA